MLFAALVGQALAADITVSHLEHFRIYRMQPGEMLVDVWPMVTAGYGKKQRDHVVTVELSLVERADGLAVKLDLRDEVNGKEVFFLAPEVQAIDPVEPFGVFSLHGIAARDETTGAPLFRTGSNMVIQPETHHDSSRVVVVER